MQRQRRLELGVQRQRWRPVSEDQWNGWRPAQSSPAWKSGVGRSEGKWNGDKAAWTDRYWKKPKEHRDSFSMDNVFTHGPDNILGLNYDPPPKLSVDDKREKTYVAMRQSVRAQNWPVRPKSGDADSDGEDSGADSNSDGEDAGRRPWLPDPPMDGVQPSDSGQSPVPMDGVEPSDGVQPSQSSSDAPQCTAQRSPDRKLLEATRWRLVLQM